VCHDRRVLTLLLYFLGALIVFGGLFVLAVYVVPKGEQIAPPAPDLTQWALAERRLHAGDIVNVRLPVGLRGYRFAETDLLLDRLTEELRMRDEEIDRLRGFTEPPPPAGREPGSPYAEPESPYAAPDGR
jgi:hypothetical protein